MPAPLAPADAVNFQNFLPILFHSVCIWVVEQVAGKWDIERDTGPVPVDQTVLFRHARRNGTREWSSLYLRR